MALSVLAIGLLTVGSGIFQTAAPRAALRAAGGTGGELTILLTAVLGAFTILFGALLLHALLMPDLRRYVLPWLAIQKTVGASGMATARLVGLMGTGAAFGAVFDAVAGMFLFWLWQRERRRTKFRAR